MFMKENLNSYKKTSVSVGSKRDVPKGTRAGDRGVSGIAGALEIIATSVGGHFSWLLVCQNRLSVL